MKLFPSLSNNINQEIMTLVRHAMRNTAKIAAGKVATRHEAKDGHIFIFFSPRSGSTWLTEAFTAQPHMRSLEDPFNWRNAFPYHMRHLPRPSGYFFSEQDMTPEVQDFIADLAEGRKHAGADWRYWLSHFREPTHRATFKFCNMTWALDSLTESFKARSILLLRHPATVAISQKNWGRRPALEAYRQHLTRIYDAPAQECLARLQACPQADDPITVSVTEWCIENWPHISGRLNCSHYVIHYEHLVTRTAEETESIAAFTGGLDMEAFIRLAVQTVQDRFGAARQSDRTGLGGGKTGGMDGQAGCADPGALWRNLANFRRDQLQFRRSYACYAFGTTPTVNA